MSNNSNNHNNGGGRNTPKNSYSQNTPPQRSGDIVPSGVLIYSIVALIFCTVFNLIYVTGMIDFTNDSFDTIVSTVGVVLPVTAAVFIGINME